MTENNKTIDLSNTQHVLDHKLMETYEKLMKQQRREIERLKGENEKLKRVLDRII
jgi:hypothetical protein